MQKIDERSVIQVGERGTAISLPAVFSRDNEINKGDTVDVYRDQIEVNGYEEKKDVLIIVPKEKRN